MSQSFLQKINHPKIKPSLKKLVGANNTDLGVLGSVNLLVTFDGEVITPVEEGEEITEEEIEESSEEWREMKKRKRQKVFRKEAGVYLIEFLIVENLLVPILRGFPSMQELGMIIDTRQGTVALGSEENEIMISYRGKTEDYVCVTETTYMEPRKQDQRIKVKVGSSKKEEGKVFGMVNIINMP